MCCGDAAALRVLMRLFMGACNHPNESLDPLLAPLLSMQEVKHGQVVVHALLQHPEVDVSIKGNDGECALACANVHPEVITHGAATQASTSTRFFILTAGYNTCFHLACESGYTRVVT